MWHLEQDLVGKKPSKQGLKNINAHQSWMDTQNMIYPYNEVIPDIMLSKSSQK